MKLSLDTHVFLWCLGDPARLSTAARAAIDEPANEIFLSVAAVWEIMIKLVLGKLRLQTHLGAWLPLELRSRGITPLPVGLPHVVAVEDLPLHHQDPFDRLLLAQAQVEGLTLVTHDRQLAEYGQPILWA